MNYNIDLDLYDAIIFDYDGTLLNSMPVWEKTPSSFIRYLGLEPQSDLDRRIPILTDDSSIELLKSEYKINSSKDEILEKMMEYIDYVYPLIPLKDGALELIECAYNKKKKMFILSASESRIIIPSVEARGIKKYFDKVISVYDLNLSKETGEGYKILLDELKPNKVLVLEDSFKSALAAKSLGMDVIGICDSLNTNNKQNFLDNSIPYIKLEDINFL